MAEPNSRHALKSLSKTPDHNRITSAMSTDNTNEIPKATTISPTTEKRSGRWYAGILVTATGVWGDDGCGTFASASAGAVAVCDDAAAGNVEAR